MDRSVMERASVGDPVALCQAMVAIPSVNPDLEEGGVGEERIAHQCKDWLVEWGYETEVFEVATGRWNVVARGASRAGGKRLILNGHLDTVGVEGMTGPRFSGEVKGGRVWGRGACDMKGGLAVILATAAKLASEGPRGSFPLAGELLVALTADEENASVGMQRFVGGAPRADGAVVCEPTGLSVMPSHKGFLWIEALFRGKAAHGSLPQEGVDAVLHAARFLTALDSLDARLKEGTPHPLLALPSFHVGTIQGGSAPSVYPQECSLVLERRTLPEEHPDSIFQGFQRVLDNLYHEVPQLDAELRPGLFRPGSEVPLNSNLVQELLSALEEEGLPPVVAGMTAWVDAGLLNQAGIPSVCFGPGSIAQAHSSEEWVPVEELLRGAQVLTGFTRQFLSS